MKRISRDLRNVERNLVKFENNCEILYYEKIDNNKLYNIANNK
jgi:hypothetical protein